MSKSSGPDWGFVEVTLYPERVKVVVPRGRGQGSCEFPKTDKEKSKEGRGAR